MTFGTAKRFALGGSLLAILLAGCGSTPSGATAPSAVAAMPSQTSSESASATEVDGIGAVHDVEELTGAWFAAAGGSCEAWVDHSDDAPTTQLARGYCDPGGPFFWVFESAQDASDFADQAKANDEDAGRFGAYIVGENWVISPLGEPDWAELWSIMKEIGGRVVKTDSDSSSIVDEPVGTFNKMTARQWKKLVKDPDSHIGDQVIIYGVIYQFDAATGSDAFLAYTDPVKRSDSYDYRENAWFVGEEEVLADFVEDDMFVAKVTVTGSLSYDTQSGGNTTVPEFEVHSIKRIN